METVKGKVIIITGASSGIGAVTARKLVALGAKVVLAARRVNELQALQHELGESAIYVQTDVSVKAQVEALITKAIAHFGKIDVLWNSLCKGIIHHQPIKTTRTALPYIKVNSTNTYA